MKITLDIVAVDEGIYVFPRPSSTEDQFLLTWEFGTRQELAREIAVAVTAAIDAMQGEAEEAMRAFFNAACERLAEERQRLDEQARLEEWSL